MPQTLTSTPASASAGSEIIPLEDVLALHGALISARARLPVLDEFLPDVLDTLRTHLKADGAMIALGDPAHPRFAGLVTSGDVPAVTGDGGAFSCPDDWIGGTTRPREWATAIATGSGLQVLAAAPLVIGNDKLGLVCLFGRPDGETSPWQQDGLAAAALEIGLAISHLRLRREVEDRLRERNERWAALYEMGVSLTRVMDGDAMLEELVKRAIHLLRARAGSLTVTDESTGKTVIKVAYADGSPVHEMRGVRLAPGEGLAAQVLEARRTVRLADFELVAAPAGGTHRLSVIAAPLFVQSAAVGVLTVADNPRERVFTDDDVQTLELLGQTAGAVLERIHGRTQEQALSIHRERGRLARELHDGLAQNLATLLLKAELCNDMARDAEPELARQIDLLAEGIQQAVRETRAAITSLREAPSDGQRLMDALTLLAARFESQTGIRVGLSWEGDAQRPYPAAAHTALLRIAQEALANVRKHAGAQIVCAHLNASHGNLVELSVQDDGCGFSAGDFDLSISDQRFGLRGMRERMAELGGTLRIETSPGCGATVIATLPLADAEGNTRG